LPYGDMIKIRKLLLKKGIDVPLLLGVTHYG